MNTHTIHQQIPVNTILHSDCIETMRKLPANSHHANFLPSWD